ncbi:MAG TPA: ECF-type sigma factor [Bryobacteraceae bacterium]|nr:ECF-type sigma factor [Bryobacteraceae bacterium]
MPDEFAPSEPGAARADLDAMAPAVYAELRRLAKHYLSSQRANHTLQPTALVHEAYLRLTRQHSVDFRNRAQFVGIAASMMRRILINYARDRKAARRDAASAGLQIESTVAIGSTTVVDLVDLNRALESLGELDPQQEKIVELRFFGGLTVEETADALAIGTATVKRNWATARLWLVDKMKRS